jgi:lipopolysaccharide transport system permease protein
LAVITQTRVLDNSAATALIRPSRSQLSLDLGLSEAWKGRHLLAVFLGRDIKVRYKQTLLGMGWAILQPLLSVGVFTLVFSRVARVTTGDVPYPVFVLCGLAPWQVFARGIARSSNSLVENQYLVTSAYIPRLILPLAAALSAFADFGIELLLLLAVMVVYHVRFAGIAALTIVPFLLLALAAALGLGLFVSALNVRYRDVGYMVPFFIQLSFFVTPVAYPSHLVPSHLRWLCGLNPMANVVEGFRWALLHDAKPAMPGLIYSVLGTVAFLLLALLYFRRVERRFADVV